MTPPARRDNCLTIVRYLAAADVMFGHFATHLSLPSNPVFDILFRWLLGVPVFFFLSGFLLWHTAGGDVRAFAGRRFRRLYPELWGAVALELITIAILYRDRVRWGGLLLFGAAQGTIFQCWTPSFLRGYGCGTPNGALWTIFVFVQFYIILRLLRKLLRGRRTVIWIAALALTAAAAAISPLLEKILPVLLYKMYGQTILPYLWMFLLGCFLSENYEGFVPVLKRFWYVPLALSVVWRFAVRRDVSLFSYPLVSTLLICCAAVGFAYAFPKLRPKTDLSYGLYIYHMIVVNAMIALSLTGRLRYGLIALGATCLLALISYFTLGRFSRRRRCE